MKSMTGYARVEGLLDDRRCVVEIKTVNHRYCDINLRLPKSFAALELTIKKYLGSKVSRGRVDATLQMENGGAADFCVGINFPLAKEYYDLLSQLKNNLNLSEDISLSHILSLKDVVSVENTVENFENWDTLQPLLGSAITSLDAMRRTEGAILKQDLQQRVKNLYRLSSEIKAHASQLTASCREKLLGRFQKLDLPFDIDESRLLTEIFLLAERADISEELLRIESHLQQCEELFDAPDPIGRKLDFIIQEINREINTIGSKSDDARISKTVIEAKSDLEKMREQVQNVE